MSVIRDMFASANGITKILLLLSIKTVWSDLGKEFSISCRKTCIKIWIRISALQALIKRSLGVLKVRTDLMNWICIVTDLGGVKFTLF